jgi:hypothetical protein
MKIFESFEDFVNNGYDKIDEGKIVLKRQYGANSAVTTIKETKVRNKVLAALKDGQLSHEDFKTIVNEFSADSKKWLNRNARYFSVSEEGVTLSSYGSKVLSHINESEEVSNESLVNEAIKSSILSSLIDMKYAPKDFLQYIYGYTKIALDQIEDTDILTMDPNAAYKRKAGRELVFYVVTNAKENPYADSSAWGDEKNLKPNTILGVANGQNEFMGASWSGRGYSADRKKIMSKADSGVGINKNYRGYGASGLYNVKRIAELADVAYVINIDALQARLSTNDISNNRAEARKGAVALLDPKKIKDENINRYKAIIAKRLTEGDKTIDKMIENAIEDCTDLIKTSIKAKQIGRYGDIIAGTDPSGREVKLSDVSSWLRNIMDDYARFTSAESNSKEDDGSSSYYQREAKTYALSIKEKVSKFKKLDIAW